MSHSMFEGEKRSVRTAILVLVMASMPLETHLDNISSDDLGEDAAAIAGASRIDANLDRTESSVPATNSWTRAVLMDLIGELDLSEDYYDGYINLLRTNYDSVTTFEIKDTEATGTDADVNADGVRAPARGMNTDADLDSEAERKRQQLSTLIKSYKEVIIKRSMGEGGVGVSYINSGKSNNTGNNTTLRSHLTSAIVSGAGLSVSKPEHDERPQQSTAEYTEFSSTIHVSMHPRRLKMQVVVEILVFLVMHLYYDARGRQTVRNLTYLLGCSATDLILCENVLAHSLSELLSASKGGKGKKGAAQSTGSKVARYAKIGVASVGVGALLAITGGLAAPAIAAAAVVAFGSGGAAVAGALATVTILGTVFGATGAGLAGYKMSRRTRGLTEFVFEQPMLTEDAEAEAAEAEAHAAAGSGRGSESQSSVTHVSEQKLAVMIMISGWMKEKDDYKTSFGVLPPDDCIDTKQRLARFYAQHNPTKLRNLKEEVKKFDRDPDSYQEMVLNVYNLDIMDRKSLCFLNSGDGGSGRISSTRGLWRHASDQAPHYVAYMDRCVNRRTIATTTTTTSSVAGESEHMDRAHGNNESSNAENDTDDEERDGELADKYSRERDMERVGFGRMPLGEEGAGHDTIAELEAEVSGLEEQGQARGQSESFTANDQANKLNMNVAKYRERYWSWREQPELAGVYEMYLLRYETALQVELGHSIQGLINSLKTSAVQKMLTVTVLSAMMSALLLPITLVKLTDIIDNTWTLAIERADMAGIELANALASRLQGTRPVTLVGHSIGARVIYSCLKELYRLKLEAIRKRDEARGEGESYQAGNVGTSGTEVDLDDDVVEYSPSILTSSAGEITEDDETSVAASSALTPNTAATTPPPAPVPAPDSSTGFFSFKSLKSKLPFGGGGSDKKDKSSANASASGSSSSNKEKDENAATAPLDLEQEVAKFDGILQDVVLLGAPVNARSSNWRRCRSMVAGRFINGYSSNDMVLRLLYRYERWQVNVAGVQPISGVVTAVQDVRSTVTAVGSTVSSAASAVKTGAATIGSAASSAGTAIGRTASSAVSLISRAESPSSSASRTAVPPTIPTDNESTASNSQPQTGTLSNAETSAAMESTDSADSIPDPVGRSHVTNAIGIENVDLSFMIDKHTDYSYKMRSILLYLNFKGVDVDARGLSAASLSKTGPGEEEEEEEEEEKSHQQKEKEQGQGQGQRQGQDKKGWYPGKVIDSVKLNSSNANEK